MADFTRTLAQEQVSNVFCKGAIFSPQTSLSGEQKPVAARTGHSSDEASGTEAVYRRKRLHRSATVHQRQHHTRIHCSDTGKIHPKSIREQAGSCCSRQNRLPHTWILGTFKCQSTRFRVLRSLHHDISTLTSVNTQGVERQARQFPPGGTPTIRDYLSRSIQSKVFNPTITHWLTHVSRLSS